VRPAPGRSVVAVGVSGGAPWPLSSSPGRSSPGRCSPASRPATSRSGPMSRRPPGSPGRALATATRAGLGPVQSRSGGRTTSPLHQSTSGADSPAQTAGESAPSVSGWANLRFARSQATVDRSIDPGCHGTALGSVAGPSGGRR
jgi:hypothetical protein